MTGDGYFPAGVKSGRFSSSLPEAPVVVLPFDHVPEHLREHIPAMLDYAGLRYGIRPEHRSSGNRYAVQLPPGWTVAEGLKGYFTVRDARSRPRIEVGHVRRGDRRVGYANWVCRYTVTVPSLDVPGSTSHSDSATFVCHVLDDRIPVYTARKRVTWGEGKKTLQDPSVSPERPVKAGEIEDELTAKAEAWLDRWRPDWRNPFAYWDPEVPGEAARNLAFDLVSGRSKHPYVPPEPSFPFSVEIRNPGRGGEAILPFDNVPPSLRALVPTMLAHAGFTCPKSDQRRPAGGIRAVLPKGWEMRPYADGRFEVEDLWGHTRLRGAYCRWDDERVEGYTEWVCRYEVGPPVHEDAPSDPTTGTKQRTVTVRLREFGEIVETVRCRVKWCPFMLGLNRSNRKGDIRVEQAEREVMAEVEALADRRYPDWKNPFAYWKQETPGESARDLAADLAANRSKHPV